MLERKGELARIEKEVDPRHISALIGKMSKAVLFENIKGYDMPVVGGLANSRKRVALGMNTDENKIGKRLLEAMANRIAPKIVPTGPVKDVILKGNDVDLTQFPIPLISKKDGAPYFSSGIVTAKDPEYGRNSGMYRLMYRSKNETGIDLVSHSDLRTFYERKLSTNKPLEMAISLGTHMSLMVAAAFAAPIGVDEFEIAGGISGEPVEMVKCETIDVEAPANAEVILECELLPTGWTEREGPFGEFNWLQGTIKWNPVVRVKCITHRANPIFQVCHMPYENDWLIMPGAEANAWDALKRARVEATAINFTVGGFCSFHAIASIKKRSGDGKNALLAMLSLGDVKLAIVTDDDINIFDHNELEWAIATRVQADKDVMVISGARGKHVDPSVQAELLPKGQLPTTAKLGIDATFPEGLTKERFERLEYPFMEEIDIRDYLEAHSKSKRTTVSKTNPKAVYDLCMKITDLVKKQPLYFYEILKELKDDDYRHILLAVGKLREEGKINRDEMGRYVLCTERNERRLASSSPF